MALRQEALPDEPTRWRSSTARSCWPATSGAKGLDDAKRYGPSAPPLPARRAVEVPAWSRPIRRAAARREAGAGRP